ncbi:MAG TPA: hypothetical protein VEW66_07870 [Thermomicrobiales bacterium]|nr:hypothetical protein [Thermomicrobiales bacterium]
MTDQPPPSELERSRAIPDGGLAASGLPEWMQERPQWSVRPVAFDVPVLQARELPAPDVSTIDLATFLTADDLPVWLQDVARRPATGKDETGHSSDSPDLSAGPARPDVESSLNAHVAPGTSPWWTSDRIMAALLIAVVLTILFVLITTVRMN